MVNLITPNEMIAAAKLHMLNGREPVSLEDYTHIIDFVATNVPPELALNVCLLMRTIYEIPISDNGIKEIVEFQLRGNN